MADRNVADKERPLNITADIALELEPLVGATERLIMDQIVKAFQEMTPEQIKQALSAVSRALASKAESLYDQDPENNGRLAQPYADISLMMETASQVWDEEEDPAIEEEDDFAQPPEQVEKPVTVTQAVTAAKDPWSGR